MVLIASVKSVHILSYFPHFGLNTERYGVSLRIQSKCGKIWTRISPNTGNFHAVCWTLLKRIALWEPADLDCILKKGDDLYAYPELTN